MGNRSRDAMKRLLDCIVVLALTAATAAAQQSVAPNNAGLPAPEGKLGGAARQPAAAVHTLEVPAEKLKIAGVPNAGKISEALLRGAQPSMRGFAELKRLGVTTIVDLRGNRSEVKWERAQSEALGIRFVNIPVLGWSSPGDAQVAQFLKLFGDKNQRIFVHCRYGEDRTGVMVAAYRIAQQKWTADEALQEMNSFGFHYHLYRGMRAYVRKFPDSYASQAAFAEMRSGTTAANAAPAAP
jgi:tyrosine-protein phosphatase SIW14